MLQQLKMFYDIVNASDDGLGLPIKNIISKLIFRMASLNAEKAYVKGSLGV